MPIFILEDDKLIIAEETTVELEQHLETWFENNPWAVIQDAPVLWIDRQPSAQNEEGTIYPDLLGVDSDRNLVIVEFKRGRAPRDVVAQLLEYAAGASEIPAEQIPEIADPYFETREEFKGSTFPKAFKEVFDIPETDALPSLNRKLRLFVIAEEIHPRVARVCRFLRRDHQYGKKVGDEEIDTPKRQQNTPATSKWRGKKTAREVVLEVVKKITSGSTKKEVALNEIIASVLKEYPDFNKKTADAQIVAGCPNHPSYRHHAGNYKFYWRIETGKYRLYDPEKDKVEGNGEAN